MNTFIRTAAFCLLSVGLVGALVSYDAYCEKCVAESQQASLFPHPKRCDFYIQCDTTSKKMRSFELPCPPTTFFDGENRVCISNTDKCNATCVSGEKFKAYGSCNNYYECINNKFNSDLKSCGDKFSFDANTGSCVSDNNCPPPSKIVDCSDFKLDVNPQVYYHNGTRQECAQGFIFNLTTCSCQELMVPRPTEPTVCTLFDAPLVTDFVETSAGRTVLNNGVKIDNIGAAYFENASLVLPAFILNDFGDQIQIDIDIMYNNPSKNEIPVLNNANCELEPTVSLMLKDALTPNCYLEATMKVQNVSRAVTLRTNVSPNVWYTFRFVKKGEKVSLWKNGASVASIDEAGNFEFQDSALVLGKSPQKASYKGYMKNLRVTKCPI